jgi:S1-C subfamily serine protease
VYVASINEGSAAEKAGLKQGDVITAINGISVYSSSELQEQVARYRPGDKIKVTYIRGEKSYDAEATLRNKLGETGIVKKEDAAIRTILGAQMRAASPDELKEVKADKGVKVLKMNTGKMKDIGVKEGFVITSVDKRKVSDPSEVDAILSQNKQAGSGVLIEGFYPNGQRGAYALSW